MERLQKIIASKGFCSRKKAEKLIIQGRVKVNDIIITKLGVKNNKYDKIKIDDMIITDKNLNKVYLMLNKPRNCISTVSDPQHRKTVLNYIKGIPQRIFPVGRLDYDTSGLLLLTNDGIFANIITHPSYNIGKIYKVSIFGYVSKKKIKQLSNGIEINPGFKTSNAEVKFLKYIKKNISIILIKIHEGKKHQIKKMIKMIGHEVIKLKRIAISFLKLDKKLKPGEWRYLKSKEINFFLKKSYLKNKGEKK